MCLQKSPEYFPADARRRPWSIFTCCGWQFAALILIFSLPASGQDAASKIKAEAERLQQAVKDKPVTVPELAPINNMTANLLKSALAAQSAGRLYVSLEELGQAEDLLRGAWTAVEKLDSVKSGLPAYMAEWDKASLSIVALDRKAKEREWSNARLAIQALAETAQGKTIPLLEGGRGFAISNGPKEGLFYLGQAQGESEFADFCAGLELPRRGAPYPLRSFLPELMRLQEKTNAAFQPPRSIELHSRFIQLNSAIKFALELDASRFYAGALYQYLDATLWYGLLDAVPVDAPQQAELKAALAAARQKLEASGQDDSLALLFVERAESHLAHADGSAPNAEEWSGTKVLLDLVLPAYEAAKRSPVPVERASGKTVDVTLIRWPYT